MPFKSQFQSRWMFANKPKMAKEWASATPSIKALPQKVGSPVANVLRSKLKKKINNDGNYAVPDFPGETDGKLGPTTEY